ncbi:uncharacterized protein [Euwallacea similis]|uniref:uncharacterized protein n=1 Tax=Euwallacea similis TaxID=1736056 RepID=UPI00344E745B
MPILLSRQHSITSLAAIVEKCQRQSNQSALEYDLQLKQTQLELILLSKPPKPPVPPKPARDVSKSPVLSKGSSTAADEGFESDIDTISLISCENETFVIDKPKPALAETDSANGGSGTESETETERTNTLTQKNVNSIKESFERQAGYFRERETFDLADCVCYSDVTHPHVLIFVIKDETLVFKFDQLERLQTFYANFTALKAVANQKAYSSATKYNLLQRTDHNGVTHIEIKKQSHHGPSGVISINAPSSKGNESPIVRSVNSRQRTESKLIDELVNDTRFSSRSDLGVQKRKVVRSSSIEDVLSVDSKESDLVNDVGVRGLRKVWNSAEDLLDCDIPRRPERRRKKKPAPLPPPYSPSLPEKTEDVFSGQFVRVSVSTERLKDFASSERNRLVVKSTANEPHPKKLGQNFNVLGRSNLSSLLKPNANSQPRKYAPPQENATLNRVQKSPLFEKNVSSSWTNSVPRILRKGSRSKSETRSSSQNFQPMAYRYIDTTSDYPYNNAMFLATLRPKTQPSETQLTTQPRISFAYNNTSRQNHESTMGNRVFGLTPKIKDFGSKGEVSQRGSTKWSSSSDLRYLDKEGGNLKSSIKHGEATTPKKKNEKKVTFSAYTTVQVV